MEITSKSKNGMQSIIQTASNSKAAERYAAYMQKFQNKETKEVNK